MKGTVVFDFDHTLADTERFKRIIAESGEAAAVERMGECVFPGAASVLGRLKASGWALALLTVGEPAWQMHKVASSGLLAYFDFAVYTAEPKETRVGEFESWPKPLVFVNDHGLELDALSAVLPDARMVAVRGPKPEPRSSGIPLCETLEDVYNVIV